jgi:adenylate cyclase
MGTVVVERSVLCQSDICSVWNVVADTERMNRAVGMESVSFQPVSDAGAARFVGTTSLGGFDVDYEERPFEWTYLRSFKVERRMRSGPAANMQLLFEFAPEGSGTAVKLRLAIEPRVGMLSPIIRMQASRTLRKFEQEIAKVDAAIAKGEPPRLRRKSSVEEDAVHRAEELLKATEPPELLARLTSLLREGSDLDVSRMRPFVLADEWGADRRAVLSLMLKAVRAGLLELRWELVCPSCRTGTDAVPSLTELKEHGTCQMCELDFGLDVDEAVEATFSPSPAVREVDRGPYCIGGPARVPHVVSQSILPPSGTATLDAPAESGRYRVFVRGGNTTQLEVATGAPAEARLPSHLDASMLLRVAPGGRVVLSNEAKEERHAKIERSTFASQAATAREVTALPAFRRDFSSDVLKPGASLRVSRVGLFFSDLTGSTQLYSNVGDAAAFRLVQDHFDVVIKLLESHGGSLVKTIGDAVMAVFSDDLDGLVASLAILDEFERFRDAHAHRQQTHIKLGLFGGPCYVVTANGILDYFGQSVNIAARLQAQAESGELVVESSLADRALAKRILSPANVLERYEAHLKGVDQPIAAVRIGITGRR